MRSPVVYVRTYVVKLKSVSVQIFSPAISSFPAVLTTPFWFFFFFFFSYSNKSNIIDIREKGEEGWTKLASLTRGTQQQHSYSSLLFSQSERRSILPAIATSLHSFLSIYIHSHYSPTQLPTYLLQSYHIIAVFSVFSVTYLFDASRCERESVSYSGNSSCWCTCCVCVSLSAYVAASSVSLTIHMYHHQPKERRKEGM